MATSSSISVETKCANASSLICDENVVKLGSVEGMNIEENGAFAENVSKVAAGRSFDVRSYTVDSVREGVLDEEGAKDSLTLHKPGFGNASEVAQSVSIDVDGTASYIRPRPSDRYLIESYTDSVSRKAKTDAEGRADQLDAMLLEDLTMSDLRYLENFPLSNSCSFDKTSVDRLSVFLSEISTGDEVDNVTPHVNAGEENRLGNPEVKTLSHGLLSKQRITNDAKSLRNGPKVVGRKIPSYNKYPRASEPRMRDVLLHLLPALPPSPSRTICGDEGVLISTILNYLTAFNLSEKEQQRLVDDAIAFAHSAIDANSDRDAITSGHNHRLAIDAELFSDAFNDLAALLPPSAEPRKSDNGVADKSAVAAKDFAAVGEAETQLSARRESEHGGETQVLPPLPGAGSYAALKSSVFNGDVHPSQYATDAKQSAGPFRSATGQRVASLIRKCLTVEIPVRNTCTFQQIDIGSTMLESASNSISKKLLTEANSVLSTVHADDAMSDSVEAKLFPNVVGQSSDVDAVASLFKQVAGDAPKVDAAPRSATTIVNNFGPRREVHKHEHAKKQAVTNLAAATEEPVAEKDEIRRKRPHDGLHDVDGGSLLKRLATLGVITGTGKRRRLSLLATYQPPMKSFYDLIDATAMTKSPTEVDGTTSQSLSRAEKATRNLSNQMITANILGTLESMQLVRSWFMAQLLAVRAETHPHTRLAKRQVLLRKYYNHLVSAYKLKKSAVRVREQASIDFDAGKKETNRVLERCKQALVVMFEDKRKLVELEKTLDIATNRYDLSRSVASTRASRKTRGGPQAASAAANADAELLLSLGAVGQGSSTTSSSVSAPGAGTNAPQHQTLYPDHHDILGGASSSSHTSASHTNGIRGQKFLSSTSSGRANLLRNAAAPAERQNVNAEHHRGSTAGDYNFRAGGGGEHPSSVSSLHPPPLFHRPQLFSSSSYTAGAGGASTSNTASAVGTNPANTLSTTAGSAAAAERPWLPTANSMLNFKKRRATALSQLLKTEIDEADMLSDLAYLNGSSQMMQNSSSTGVSSSKRKRQTAIKSNVRVDSNKLMIDDHAFHRNQTVLVEPNPLSSVAATIMLAATNSGVTDSGGNSGQFSATILSFSAGEIWLRRAFDGQKFKVSLGQLMDGTYKLMDTPYNKRK